MNRCKTCKWWKWTGRSEDFKDCVQYECSNVQSNSLHGMIDSEEYGGVFTGPEFGCVNHEETQEQLPQEHPGYAMQQIKRSIKPAARPDPMTERLISNWNEAHEMVEHWKHETVSEQIKRGVIPRRPDGSICES